VAVAAAAIEQGIGINRGHVALELRTLAFRAVNSELVSPRKLSLSASHGNQLAVADGQQQASNGG
jgi:hypothetical protein